MKYRMQDCGRTARKTHIRFGLAPITNVICNDEQQYIYDPYTEIFHQYQKIQRCFRFETES